jgi:hypothetical protein
MPPGLLQRKTSSTRWPPFILCIITSPSFDSLVDAASRASAPVYHGVTRMEVEESAAFAPSSPHLIIASPHRLCLGYMTTPPFLRALSAGDAALDKQDGALRAESDRGSALMSVTVPGRSRSASLVPLVKGRAWRHRLLRAPGMSHLVASRPSLQLSGMLDEPAARCLST